MVKYYDNIASKVMMIYPQMSILDFQYITIRNDSDGKGDYIEKWEHPTLPIPTNEQLEAK